MRTEVVLLSMLVVAVAAGAIGYLAAVRRQRASGGASSARARDELAHASRLSVVGELTATIAHEISQPLGAILNNADAGEILLDKAEPPLDEIRRILADIRRDGLRASEVIRHVRRLAKKRELELEKLDANLLISEMSALLGPEAQRRRIVLLLEPAPTPAWVSGDRALLEQVLINLVMNAMDAIDSAAAAGLGGRRPEIELGVSTTSDGGVQLWVVDAGPGIPPERLGGLFTSFHTTKLHGMGLGLSIARSIVEAHGGRIRADNPDGAGARFRINLPPCDSRFS